MKSEQLNDLLKINLRMFYTLLTGVALLSESSEVNRQKAKKLLETEGKKCDALIDQFAAKYGLEDWEKINESKEE